MIIRLKGKDHRLLVYHIDKDDHVVFVNSHWDDFFKEQKRVDLSRSSIQGRILWDLIPSHEVHAFLKEALKLVRRTNKKIQVYFRYDSVTYKRFFRLTMLPLGNGSIEFSNAVEKKISRFQTSTPEALDSHKIEAGPPCGWCNRMVDRAGSWSEVDHLEVGENCFPLPHIAPFNANVCPECVTTFSQILAGTSKPVV